MLQILIAIFMDFEAKKLAPSPAAQNDSFLRGTV
jgi:hypothetical protein